MAGSSFGKYFTVTTWGESHGEGVGVVVDGCPAGLPLAEADIQAWLDRRRPGQSRYTTARQEADQVQILSGVFEGRTTGTPISLMVKNKDHHSADYSNIKDIYRPGHADYTFDAKYGFRDYRGGGRSSGRETLGRVAAGAIAAKILGKLGILIESRIVSIGGIDAAREEEVKAFLEEVMAEKDSAGGVAECVIWGVPAGVGEPVFDKLDARLAEAMMSIGAVKGVEIGDGFAVASRRGSENNDAFRADENGTIHKKTNHAGGVLGGMSDGSRIVVRAAFKPTPSIARPQETVTTAGENTELVIHGRHDPLVVQRALVVMEAMAALAVLDLMLANMHATLAGIQKFYGVESFYGIIPDDGKE